MSSTVLGFNYRVTLQDLEFAAYQNQDLSRGDLLSLFREHVGFDRKGEYTMEKTASIMMKIWHGDPKEPETHQSLRERARVLLEEAEPLERVALHWGMAMLAYPFFVHVAQEVGRGFRLNREVFASQIHRKMKSRYGDRRKVEVATTAVLSSMKDWGALDSPKPGVYVQPPSISITHKALRLWLVEVLIRTSDAEMLPFEQIDRSPALFPFDLNLHLLDLSQSDRLEVDRQGLDLVMVGVSVVI